MEILEAFENFLSLNEYQLFYLHLDFTIKNEIDILELISNMLSYKDSGESIIQKLNINIILSPITECEESDFNPLVQEPTDSSTIKEGNNSTPSEAQPPANSIVSSIIPSQTFNYYMNKKVDIDFSKCSLLIQYDHNVTRKFKEFSTLKDVIEYCHQRHSSYGVMKSKTILGDNFMMEVAFKAGTLGKFGA